MVNQPINMAAATHRRNVTAERVTNGKDNKLGMHKSRKSDPNATSTVKFKLPAKDASSSMSPSKAPNSRATSPEKDNSNRKNKKKMVKIPTQILNEQEQESIMIE